MVGNDKYLVFDFEADHEWGLEIWHPEYKLVSGEFLLVCGDKKKFIFTEDHERMASILRGAINAGAKLVAHNMSYEYSVCKKVLGVTLPDELMVDTIRLHAFCTSNVGKKYSAALTSAVHEYFGVEDFKSEYHDYLISSGIAKTKREAKGLVGSLPSDLLESYNRADVEWTEKVFLKCLEKHAELDFNWTADMLLYSSKVRRNCDAWLRGIKFDTNLAISGLESLKTERTQYITDFLWKYREEIAEARKRLALAKAEKDYETRKAKAVNPDKIRGQTLKLVKFNLNSTAHLAVLCIDVMGMRPKVFTPAGAPAFGKDFLGQWGDVGSMMSKWKKLNKPIAELEVMIERASVDGRLHLLVREGSTVTGRGASSMV